MPPITLASARKALSSALYLALCLATLGHFVLGAPADLGPIGAALLAYLLLEVWATSRLILGLAAVLVTFGLLAQGADYGALLVEAGVRTLPFLVLFLAVLCLQGPALTSPSLRAIGGFVAAQPPGRRFASMALAGHLLGAVLNVAGLLLVLSLRDPKLPPRDQIRLTAGAMRGFGAAAAWSPLFVAMSVVLAALPSLRNEALIFFAANTFGLGLSAALDPALLAQLAAILPEGGLSIPILIMTGLLIAGMGVHPIVIVVAVGTVLSPEHLHLSDMETALSLLVVWGMGEIMSPF